MRMYGRRIAPPRLAAAAARAAAPPAPAAPAAVPGPVSPMARLPRGAGMPARAWAGAQAAAGVAGDALRPMLDPLRIALFTLILMTVSRVHQHFTIIGRLRPALLAMAVAAGYAVLRPSSLPMRNFVRYWPGKVILALLVLACLSIPFGISLGGSAQFMLDNYSKVVLCAAFVAVAVRSARDLYLFVWAYVAASAILAWMMFSVFQLQTYGGYQRLAELYSYDSNDAGLVLLVGLPLAVLTFQTGRRWSKLASAGIVLAIGAAVARTGSRGALVGMGVVGFFLLIGLKQISVGKRVGVLAAAFVAMVAFAPPGYWQQMSTILNAKEDYNWTTENGRKQVAQRGLSYMMQYPVFGLGINNFARAECSISDKAKNHVDNTPLRCSAPHNTWVQTASELGIGGFVLWCMLLFGGVASMRRLARRLPKAWEYGTREQRFLYLAPAALALSLVSFMITSTFLSFAWIDTVYLVAAFMIGLYHCVDVELARSAGGAMPVAPGAASVAGRRGIATPRGGRFLAPVPRRRGAP